MVPRPAPLSTTLPHIPEFFSGREVFITGATGFMGKVLVERLLWTCPEVSRLHLLLRPKKDVAPDKRLKQLLQSKVFDVIRQNCPERLQKLSMVVGDITKHHFGIDREMLQKMNQVSVVFHSAATLKFDEPLKVAVEQNLRSVLTLMDICDQLPLMQVLLYVSTAYSNTELTSIDERVYTSPIVLQQLLALVDNLPEHLLTQLTPQLISPKPNTYTFTKAMAESALADRARTCAYSTAIFRPTIVVSSLQYPFPGWIENLNGPSGVMVGAGKGLLHTLLCAGDKRADMIPVDIAIDTLIAAAWETGIEDSRETRVYNCSSYDNPTTWDEFRIRMIRGVRVHPFDTPLWYPFGFFTKSMLVMNISEWLLQAAPLHVLDFLYTILGAKQRLKMSTVCYRLRAMNDALKFFTLREWKFSTDNVTRLKERLSSSDAAIYNIDPHTIDWEAHCMDFVKGTRKYLLQEKDKDLNKAHARIRILYILHRLTQFLIAFIVCRVAIKSTTAILRTIAVLMKLKKNAQNMVT